MDWNRARSWLYRDAYSGAGYLLFACMALILWKPHVRKHEAIYLLGSRRVADPEFLAADPTWGALPPTTFVYDHGMALLGFAFSDFEIVVLGRLLTWGLLAGALAMLARQLRIPPWSVVVGTALFLLWGQTLFSCGRMLEGFQPKSFAYSLTFFALCFVMRGQPVRAGIASGLATAVHVIDGGWACLAIFLAMLLNPKLFSIRQIGAFLAATAPWIAPLVLAIGFFHVGGVEPGARAQMDEIYVTFAQPHCCDPEYFMTQARWMQALTVFPVSVLLLLLWPEKPASRILACFVAALVGIWAVGVLASAMEVRWFQKLYPYQLAASYPALLLLIMSLAFFGVEKLRSRLVRGVWAAGLVISVGLVDDHDVTDEILEIPERVVAVVPEESPSRYGRSVSSRRQEVYAWIRENTGRDSVFATPYLPEFWTYAERAQVAAFRHPPHDQKLIEWKARLEALNGFQEFDGRGFEIRAELNRNQRALGIEDLIRLRDLYGASYYLTEGRVKPSLARNVAHVAPPYVVYRLDDLPGRE